MQLTMSLRQPVIRDHRFIFHSLMFHLYSPISHSPLLVPWMVSYDRLDCTPCGLLEGLQLEIELVVLASIPKKCS